jgi:hypothetical protein
MILVYSIAIYFISLLILAGINIVLNKFMPMWIMFIPIVNSVLVIYVLIVSLTCILCNILDLLNGWLNIMLNKLTVEIPKKINKILYK